MDSRFTIKTHNTLKHRYLNIHVYIGQHSVAHDCNAQSKSTRTLTCIHMHIHMYIHTYTQCTSVLRMAVMYHQKAQHAYIYIYIYIYAHVYTRTGQHSAAYGCNAQSKRRCWLDPRPWRTPISAWYTCNVCTQIYTYTYMYGIYIMCVHRYIYNACTQIHICIRTCICINLYISIHSCHWRISNGYSGWFVFYLCMYIYTYTYIHM